MGTLHHPSSGDVVALLSRTLVGRGPLSHLRLDDPQVSSEHATLYFLDGGWRVRDLASRNGTYVDGERIEAGASPSVTLGSSLAFGQDASSWVLVDASPMGPAALRAEGVVTAQAPGALWLPDEESPGAHILVDDGAWFLETSVGREPLRHGQEITVSGRVYRLSLPAVEALANSPMDASTLQSHADGSYGLKFKVSQDQEHVSVEAIQGSRSIVLGARSHNHLLLELARQRVQDTDQGAADAEAGWIYVDDLMARLKLERGALNVQVWRAVQTLKQAGLNADALIERRVATGQLRLGIFDLAFGN